MADNQRIEDLRRRVQRDPASIAFAQLAEELRRAGQFEESVDICRAGLAIHPGYLSARVTLGRALLELNQLGEAQGELEHVLKNAPENLAAIRGLGEIHHRQGNLSEALAQYRAALALARNDPDLQETVSQLARQVEPQKPAVVDEGLSFDQMQHELLKRMGPPAPPPPQPLAAAASSPEPAAEPAGGYQQDNATADPAAPAAVGEPAWPSPLAEEQAPPLPVDTEQAAPVRAAGDHLSVAMHDHAARTVAALEEWLEAIHVARADRRP